MASYFVGLTGASGHLYTTRLLRALVLAGHRVHLSVTAAGCKVLQHEMGVDAGTRGELLVENPGTLRNWLGDEVAAGVTAFGSDAVEAPASSGTAGIAGVILVPCSMGSLARVAAGFSSNLVERAADVALKEGKTLIIVPRETPFSALHLENMQRLAGWGAVILPAAPGFYHRPRSIEQLVDVLVGKILDRLGVEHKLSEPWDGELEPYPEAGVSQS